MTCGMSSSVVEPDVFHAPTVEDTIGRYCQPFDTGLPAGCAAPIEDGWPCAVFRQFPFDLPDQFLACLRVGFGRLPVYQLVHLGIAISVKVGLRPAHVIRVESRI